MKKIPCVFLFDNSHSVTTSIHPLCRWVLDGEGITTRKFDGTACAIIDGKLYARYDCKPAKAARKRHKKGEQWEVSDFKQPPSDAIPCEDTPNLDTGHWPHWVPVDDQPQYKHHAQTASQHLEDGTYELCGPKFGGNKDGFDEHVLIKHGQDIVKDFPRDFDGMRDWLEQHNIEGVVFHHGDGRMAKIRRRDFGFDW